MSPKQRKTAAGVATSTTPAVALPPAPLVKPTPAPVEVRRKRRHCCCSRVGISFLTTCFLIWIAVVYRNEIPASTPIGVLVEEPSRPGMHFNVSSKRCKRPVVIVPGFVSTALEVWENLPCASSRLSTDFRKRLFGASMLLTLLENPACFFQHASLNPDDASDPPGVKLRPDSGFSSVDYIIPGFWVWAKVFRNLADVGYSPENIYVASYDWRLSPKQMATRRVGYFDRMKIEIEHLHKRARDILVEEDGESLEAIDEEGCDRAVFVTHSYGGNVLTAFLAWADQREPGWTDKHVHAFINVGGPLLGISKATAAILSGEFRDTAMLPKPTRALVDSSLPRELRAQAFRTWPCLWALSPLGGDAVWPNLTYFSNGTSLGATRVHRELLATVARLSNHTLLSRSAAEYDELAIPQLPVAKRMHVLCIYGVAKPAESGYAYTMDPPSNDSSLDEAARWTSLRIDSEASNNGVILDDGDGTVPLHSLGYLCHTELPVGMKAKVGRVTIQEHPDQVVPGAAAAVATEEEEVLQKILHALDGIGLPDPRGGVATGDHVDIMGNHLALETIINVALGPKDVPVVQQIVSNIGAETKRLDDVFGRFAKAE